MALEIDNIIVDTYEIVVETFSLTNKVNQVRFFKETFLVTNISPEVVFGMLFLILSGVNIDFLNWKLR